MVSPLAWGTAKADPKEPSPLQPLGTDHVVNSPPVPALWEGCWDVLRFRSGWCIPLSPSQSAWTTIRLP
jgi:hypothetical protein